MKKFLTIALMILVSSSAFAKNKLLFKTEGEGILGTKCGYEVYEMNNWEGQIVVFLSSDTGNFRLELNKERFYAGQFVSQYSEGQSFSYSDGLIDSTIFATEWFDSDKTVSISVQDDDLYRPIDAIAKKGSKYYHCRF